MTSYLTLDLDDTKKYIAIDFAKNPPANKENIKMYKNFGLYIFSNHFNQFIEVNENNYNSFDNYCFISPFESIETIIDYSRDYLVPNNVQNIQYLNLNIESDSFASDTKAYLNIENVYLKYYNNYPGGWVYKNSSFPIFLKFFNKCYPLINEDDWNLRKEKMQYVDIDFPTPKEIKKMIKNGFNSEKIYIIKAKKRIERQHPNIYKFQPSQYEINDAKSIIDNEIYDYMKSFKRFILGGYSGKCREEKIYFECIIYHIYKEPLKMMENIIKFLPVNKATLQNIYNQYNSYQKDRDILLHNFIYYFHKFYSEQKNEFENNELRIKISNPKSEKLHEELLFNYIEIPSNNPGKPTELKEYLDKLENNKPKEENNDYSKGKKINIKGNNSEIVDENTKPKINLDITNNENIHLDNDIKIDFPEIKLFKENYLMNIKNINEFLNKYIIYCRIFPLYIRHLKKII